jgi:hypothetical protein
MSNLTINLQPIQNTTSKVVESVANSIGQDARVLAPIGSTGALRNSIRATKVGELQSNVTADVPYAIYVDDGEYLKTPLQNLDLYILRGRQQ